MDGCAILYKKSRFTLVEKHALEFNHVAMSRAKQFNNDKALQCLLKDNVALGECILNKWLCLVCSISTNTALQNLLKDILAFHGCLLLVISLCVYLKVTRIGSL